MIDQLIERLPVLTGAEVSRLEAAARRELDRRKGGADYDGAPRRRRRSPAAGGSGRRS